MIFHPRTTYGSDRFRQIFIDHWHRWLDLHEEDIPADQRAYVRKTIQKMLGCRNPQSGYARYVCTGCGEERIVPFSCKTRFCPSCGKVRTDEWVNRIAQELLDVPHLHLTLTTPSTSSSRRDWETGTQCAVPLLDCAGLGIPPKGLQLVRHAGLYARNCLS